MPQAQCIWQPTASNCLNEVQPASQAAAEASHAPSKPVIIFHDGGDWGATSHVASGSVRDAGITARAPEPVCGAASELQKQEPSLTATQECSKSAGYALWRQLLTYALTDPLMSSDKMKFGSEMHRQKASDLGSCIVFNCIC